MRLILATRNRHKAREIKALFDIPGLVIQTADRVPGAPRVDETADTLEGNAVLKARTLARHTGCWALADDSGLEVEALGGAPGVHSARYAGPTADDRANNRKLLQALRGSTRRRARFRCVLALAHPDGAVHTVSGECQGRIAEAPRGRGGFGYDPLFIPEGSRKTFAELDPDTKNRISHRGRALAAFKKACKEWLGGGGSGEK